MTKIEKAEKIRQITWDYIREHGLVEIMDEDDNSSYKTDIIAILEG